MDSNPEPRVLWSFWIACGLATTGAIAPLVLANGDLGRAAGVAIPFAIAAIVLAAMALTYPQGRSFVTALYILAWIAIVYGILRLIAVPLQEAVTGLCPVGDCTAGISHPFGTNETVAITVGILTGALALQVGLFGLRALYRSERKHGTASYSSPPPTRVIPPARSVTHVPPPADEPIPASPSSVAAPAPDPVTTQPARKPRAKRTRKPAVEPAPQAEQAELPAHEEPPELPAHEDPPELPPHSSTTSSD
jgi:hypothetical protein